MDDLIARIESYIPKGDGYNSEFAHDLAEAVELLRERQWVSVADRLPEKDVEVLVLNTNAEIQLDTWVDLYESPVSFSTKSICVGEGWESSDFEDVTHWCALPPIEQEQEQENDC